MDKNHTIISFSTKGDWVASDVVALVQSASDIYDALAAFYVSKTLQQRREEEIKSLLEQYLKYFDHPVNYEWYRLWREILRDYRKQKLKGRLLTPIIHPPFFLGEETSPIPSHLEILENIELYRDITTELTIYKIQIASPGEFSFSGLGDIVQQFRELIKDIWYRNSQEKRKGELEIIEKHLALLEKHPDSELANETISLVDRKIAKRIQSKIETFRRLEAEGKLLSLPDHVERRPKK